MNSFPLIKDHSKDVKACNIPLHLVTESHRLAVLIEEDPGKRQQENTTAVVVVVYQMICIGNQVEAMHLPSVCNLSCKLKPRGINKQRNHVQGQVSPQFTPDVLFLICQSLFCCCAAAFSNSVLGVRCCCL